MSEKTSVDAFESFHKGVFLVHETLRSGMDQILEHAPKVSCSDVPNFIGYVKAFIAHLTTHHDHEELIIFPAIKPKIPIDEFLEDHRKLNKVLNSLSDYTTQVTKKKVTYESAKVVEFITQLGDIVRPHLKHEESVFTVESLRENMTKEELEKINNDIADSIKKEGGATTTLPFLLHHLDQEGRQFMVYDSMPKPVRVILLPVFVNWHKGYWKYAKYQSL
ncbi:13179_t:CDS:2 [Acaulospora morrowiae]|uniref:13179_t:CDS:1 n=1 Tax=Acaulospora morrowiae TaxID=94023 RepID=A0A9N9HXM5_9GLOM|nr:13179_t:CDS:2 [Acaulospora morrowiae]